MYRCTACCTNHKNISGGIVDLWSRFGHINQQCHTNLFNLIASVLVAKHCLKSKNEPSNMFYWCLIYKALLWLRLFDFSQLTFPRDIFPSKSSARVPTRSFEKISTRRYQSATLECNVRMASFAIWIQCLLCITRRCHNFFGFERNFKTVAFAR